MRKHFTDFLRCFFGIHCVPKHWAFEDMAAVCAGGVCPRCGQVKYRKFICNTWIGHCFQAEGEIVLLGHDVSPAIAQGYEIKGDIEDLCAEWQEAHGKGKKAITR